MDTRTKLPFSLCFEQQGRPAEEPLFFHREQDIDTCIVIKENIDVIVFFQSEEEGRLYIEGLECIPYIAMDEERGEPYLHPSAQKRIIFSHDQFPLIPGDYLVKVYCGAWYYTMLRVQPKQMTFGQLQVMKEEIENFLKGLAYDVVQKEENLKAHFCIDVTAQYVKHGEQLTRYYKSVLPSVMDLVTKMNARIKTSYEFIPKDAVHTIDGETILHQLRYPEKQEVKVPLQEMDYDLPENRWLKKMILFLQKELQMMRTESDLYKEKVEVELQRGGNEARKKQLLDDMQRIQGIGDCANKLHKACFLLQRTPWFEEIGGCEGTMMPRTLHVDARYRSLFQLYREWRRDEKIEWNPVYNLRFKRTDKLYEIWGFIQFLQVLTKDLQFIPKSGWIFSSVFHEQSFLIPTLEQNTQIVLEKEDLTLHFYYEGEVPLNPEETKKQEQPLFTESANNCPDMRLDVFASGIYIGSILFDFKYRPLHHIWDMSRITQKSSTMRKLSQYVVACKSKFLYGIPQAKYIRPVHEVWAIHPNVHANYPVVNKLDHHDICVVQLSPNHGTDHIATHLQATFTELLEKRNIFV